MRQHKYQLIRVHVPKPGASVRFTGETDQSFDRLAGIFVAMPDAVKEMGAALGLRIGGQEVFDEDHDVRLITCGREVSPNEKFFQFPSTLKPEAPPLRAGWWMLPIRRKAIRMKPESSFI